MLDRDIDTSPGFRRLGLTNGTSNCGPLKPHAVRRDSRNFVPPIQLTILDRGFSCEANAVLTDSSDPRSTALELCFTDFNSTGLAKDQEKYRMLEACSECIR